MSYLLSGLDLVVNNTTSIVVNTNQTTIQGDIATSENVIAVGSTYNRFSVPDNAAAATIKSTSKATSLTGLTAKALGTTQVPISTTVEGNGLKDLSTSYYEGITYSPKLLTCVGVNSTSTTIGDLSSSNFTITNNGAATVSTFGPFLLSSFAYDSVLFNGTTQSLTTTVTTGSPLDLADGGGDWTIEGWFYVTSIATGSRSVLWKTNPGNASYAFWINAATPQWIIGDGGGGGTAINLAVITANTWYHFALVRIGNTLTPYMNGVAQTGATMDFTMGNGVASALLYIGAASDGRYFPGYISNVRVVKGAAIYKGNFLPPAQNFSAASITNITTKVNATTSTTTKLTYEPLKINLYNNLKYSAPTGQQETYDPDLVGNSRINSYVVSNLANKHIKSDTEIVNVSLSPEFYVNGPDSPIILSTEGRGDISFTGSTLITPVKNGGSFNGINQYLTAPANLGFNFGSDSFTLETWVYYQVTTAAYTIMGHQSGPSPGRGWMWTMGIGGDLAFGWSISGNGAINSGGAYYSTAVAPLNQWAHVAFVRSGTTYTFYINGVAAGSGAMSGAVNYVGSFAIGYTPNETTSGQSYFKGYMSNSRIVKGVAVYTGNFTVPTKPLTKEQNASTNISAILATQTSLLTLNSVTLVDNSNLANTITNNNGVTIASTYSPTWTPYLDPLSTGGFKFEGGASNQRLNLPSSSTFNLSDGTWTIEFWMYSTATPTLGNQCRIFMFGINGLLTAFAIGYNNDGSITAARAGGASVGITTSAGAITLNRWYHVAVVSTAGSAKIFINGTQSGSTTTITQPTSSSPALNIGYDTVDTVNFQYAGYLSNIRIVNKDVYIGNFTVPTSPLTKTQISTTSINAITGSETYLLIGQDGTLLDHSDFAQVSTNSGVVPSALYGPVLGTVSNTTTTTVITPVRGGGSFNGTSQYLTAPIGSSPFTAGDFTVEAWFYKSAATTNSPLSNVVSGDPYFWAISTYADGHWQFQINDGTSIEITGSILTSINTWIHIAATRQSGLVKLFVNGVLDNSATITKTITANPTLIGSFRGLNYFTGYISNVRITSVAVYTGNFTVPTKPLTKEQNASTNISAILAAQTSLLTLQNPVTLVDNSSLANTITNNNGVTIASTNSPTWASYAAPLSTGGFKFNGVISEYYTLPALNTVFQFGTGDFTIELWVYITKGQTGYIYDTRPTTTQGAYATLYYSHPNGWISYDTDSSSRLTAPVSLNTWYHVAVCRIGGSTKMYLNGAQSGSSYSSGSSYLTSSSPTIIGAASYTTGAAPFAGQISNLRVVKGLGVYIGNFTVPTSPLTKTQTSSTNISPIVGGFTSLLTAQDGTKLDYSDNAATISSSVNSVTPSVLYGPVIGTVSTAAVNSSPGAYVSTPPINTTNIEYIDYRTDPRSVNKRVKNLIVGTTGVLEELQSWS